MKREGIITAFFVASLGSTVGVFGFQSDSVDSIRDIEREQQKILDEKKVKQKTASQQLSALSERLQDLQTENSKFTSEHTELKKRISELEVENQSLIAEVDEYYNGYEEWNKVAKGCKLLYEAEVGKNSALQAEYNEQLTSIREKNSALEAKLLDLDLKYTKNLSELGTSLIEAGKQDFSSIKATVDVVQNKINQDISTALEDITNEVTALYSDIEESLNNSEDNVKNYKNQLSITQSNFLPLVETGEKLVKFTAIINADIDQLYKMRLEPIKLKPKLVMSEHKVAVDQIVTNIKDKVDQARLRLKQYESDVKKLLNDARAKLAHEGKTKVPDEKKSETASQLSSDLSTSGSQGLPRRPSLPLISSMSGVLDQDLLSLPATQVPRGGLGLSSTSSQGSFVVDKPSRNSNIVPKPVASVLTKPSVPKLDSKNSSLDKQLGAALNELAKQYTEQQYGVAQNLIDQLLVNLKKEKQWIAYYRGIKKTLEELKNNPEKSKKLVLPTR